MSEVTTEIVTWSDWPTGAQIEETDRDVWIWTGKLLNGKHLIVLPNVRVMSGWYRLLPNDQLSNYTWLPDRTPMPDESVGWMHRAAQMDEARLREVKYGNEARADWSLLNEALNEYADNKGLCGEYERQLDEWNDSFGTLKLEGRTKTYSVELTVRASFTTTVEVEATSEDDATDKAGNLDWDEVTANLDMSDANDMDWEVDDATAQ